MKGALLAVAVLALTVLLLEGGYSLWARESLVDRLLFGSGGPQLGAAMGERDAGAALTEGPYALDRDPDVKFRMKAGATATFVGVEATTDRFGDRVRLGPAEDPEGRRVVVLGDSVAFGYGVADDETYAHALEELLAAALPAGAPRPVARTVACAGWNFRSSFRYFRNHVERLDPDVVLYVAVPNDLDDATIVNELGWRSMDVDPSDDRPQASIERHSRLVQTMEHAPSRAAALEVVQAGGLDVVDYALRTRVTPESRRRWREFLDAIQGLHRDLAARGTELAVVLPFGRDFHRQLEILLAREAPEIPVLGLVDERADEDTLGVDPHANARCLRAGALWMAELVIERGWLPGADAARLPAQDERYAERRFEPLPPARHEAFLDELHAVYRRFLRDAVDLVRAEGIHQVYGGLLGDGTVGKLVFAGLCREGATRLEVSLERLPAASAVYPLRIAVEVDGEDAGAIDVAAPGEGEDPAASYELALPPGAAGRDCVDVLLRASNWVAWGEGEHLIAFRLRRLALLP